MPDDRARPAIVRRRGRLDPADRPAVHRLVQLVGRRVGLGGVHPAAHVRVDRQDRGCGPAPCRRAARRRPEASRSTSATSSCVGQPSGRRTRCHSLLVTMPPDATDGAQACVVPVPEDVLSRRSPPAARAHRPSATPAARRPRPGCRSRRTPRSPSSWRSSGRSAGLSCFGSGMLELHPVRKPVLVDPQVHRHSCSCRGAASGGPPVPACCPASSTPCRGRRPRGSAWCRRPGPAPARPWSPCSATELSIWRNCVGSTCWRPASLLPSPADCEALLRSVFSQVFPLNCAALGGGGRQLHVHRGADHAFLDLLTRTGRRCVTSAFLLTKSWTPAPVK